MNYYNAEGNWLCFQKIAKVRFLLNCQEELLSEQDVKAVSDK
jgi:hypothetical protein